MLESPVETAERQLKALRWHVDALAGATVEARQRHGEQITHLCDALEHLIDSIGFPGILRSEIRLRMDALRARMSPGGDTIRKAPWLVSDKGNPDIPSGSGSRWGRDSG